MSNPAPVRGRGAAENPASRFIRLYHERDDQCWTDPDDPAPATRFYRDAARTALNRVDSDAMPFGWSLNPYRGCEHGCAYCYARPAHERLGFSAGLDFETRVLVKEDAPELLEAELGAPSWEPAAVALSGVTDPYQPVERRLCLTRRCLAVFARFRNPVALISKNALIARDIDHLASLAEHGAVTVTLSVTTLDAALAGTLEPRASAPAARLRAIRELAAAGVPVGVTLAPVIPGLTDHEMPAILAAAREAGAAWAMYQTLFLPPPVDRLFGDWLAAHAPGRRERVLGRVADIGPWGRLFADLFRVTRLRLGFGEPPALSGAAFRRGRPVQRLLWE